MRKREAIRDMWAFEEQKQEAVDALNAMLAGDSEAVSSDVAVVARAAKLALEAAASGLGECRETTPYAALYPLIDENGKFKWCCTHDSEHCSS